MCCDVIVLVIQTLAVCHLFVLLISPALQYDAVQSVCVCVRVCACVCMCECDVVEPHATALN